MARQRAQQMHQCSHCADTSSYLGRCEHPTQHIQGTRGPHKEQASGLTRASRSSGRDNPARHVCGKVHDDMPCPSCQWRHQRRTRPTYRKTPSLMNEATPPQLFCSSHRCWLSDRVRNLRPFCLASSNSRCLSAALSATEVVQIWEDILSRASGNIEIWGQAVFHLRQILPIGKGSTCPRIAQPIDGYFIMGHHRNVLATPRQGVGGV